MDKVWIYIGLAVLVLIIKFLIFRILDKKKHREDDEKWKK